MEKKIIVDVRCLGNLPGTVSVKCDEILYQSDGQFLYIANLILNQELEKQKVVCGKCGFEMIWRRNTEFRKGKK